MRIAINSDVLYRAFDKADAANKVTAASAKSGKYNPGANTAIT